MDTLGKTELTASIRHIAIFLKLGIPIYNSEDPERLAKKLEEGEEEEKKKKKKKKKKKNTGNCNALCVSRKHKKEIKKIIIN